MKPNVCPSRSKMSLAYDSDEDDLPLTFELPRKPNVCPSSKSSLAYDSDEDDLPLTFELPRSTLLLSPFSSPCSVSCCTCLPSSLLLFSSCCRLSSPYIQQETWSSR
mmetsp:Transcript_26570/g.60614  ORF Transcript_26570/g.60614 Transcript_26570/m.60614 type:complete len:107 (-) Transcript_26570:144-464(-)